MTPSSTVCGINGTPGYFPALITLSPAHAFSAHREPPALGDGDLMWHLGVHRIGSNPIDARIWYTNSHFIKKSQLTIEQSVSRHKEGATNENSITLLVMEAAYAAEVAAAPFLISAIAVSHSYEA